MGSRSRCTGALRYVSRKFRPLRTSVLRSLCTSLRRAVRRRSLRSTLPRTLRSSLPRTLRTSRWSGPLLLLRRTLPVRHSLTRSLLRPTRRTGNRTHGSTRSLRTACLSGSLHLRPVRPLRPRSVLARPRRTTLQRRSPVRRLLLGMLASTARGLALRSAATWLLTEPTGLLCMLTEPTGLLCMLTGTAGRLNRYPLRRPNLLRRCRRLLLRWLCRPAGRRLRGCTGGWFLTHARRRRRRWSGRRRLSEQRVRSPTAQRVRWNVRATWRFRWGCAVPGRERGFVLSQR
jgi:hypothetical protein